MTNDDYDLALRKCDPTITQGMNMNAALTMPQLYGLFIRHVGDIPAIEAAIEEEVAAGTSASAHLKATQNLCVPLTPLATDFDSLPAGHTIVGSVEGDHVASLKS